MGNGSVYSARMEQSPVEYVPRRAISLAPALTESLFDLALGDRLIAVSDDCARPVEGVQLLPRVGRVNHPDIDRIVSLKPDLVLLNDTVNYPEHIDALRLAGVPVWVTTTGSVFDTLNLLWNIMYVFDHAVMVPRVREIERAYDYTLAAARGLEPVRVLALIGCDPWRSFNADTYAHDVLRVCGGENICAGRVERYPAVTLEEVVQANPDVILLPDESFSNTSVDTLRALDISAARTGRIHRIDRSLLTWAGTRLAYALRDLPSLVMRGGADHDSSSGST